MEENKKRNKFSYEITKPLKDVNGKVLKKGMQVKKIIPEFNYQAGLQREISSGFDEDGTEIWIAISEGMTTYINPERAKNYEIMEEKLEKTKDLH